MLAQVANRDLIIGEPWTVLVRIRNLDMTGSDWACQIRPYPQSEALIAAPVVEAVLEDDDTLVYVSLPDTDTEEINPGLIAWGLKADDHSLFFGYLEAKMVPVR